MELHGYHYFADNPAMSRAKVLELLTTVNLRNADRIRVLSDGMKNRLLERYGNHLESRVAVLPPRVDLSLFGQRAPRRGNGLPVAIMVGSVNDNKGQLRFIRAFLDARLPGQAWIVGDGPDLQACKEFVATRQASEQVRFFGRVNHQRLAELLAESHVFVQFSRSEATPRAILEGMAAGLPVVASDAGFCRDMFRHGVDGYLLGSNAAADVVTYLRALFEDESLRHRMGESAAALAGAEYDAQHLFERYRQLIRETAAS